MSDDTPGTCALPMCGVHYPGSTHAPYCSWRCKDDDATIAALRADVQRLTELLRKKADGREGDVG